MSGKHILIIGSGSAGQRHARNLSSLGCRISCVDPREDRLKEAQESCELVSQFVDLPKAFAEQRYDGVAIASPTVFHPEQGIQALEQGYPLLLEKPVAKTLADAQSLASAERNTLNTPN